MYCHGILLIFRNSLPNINMAILRTLLKSSTTFTLWKVAYPMTSQMKRKLYPYHKVDFDIFVALITYQIFDQM